MKTSAEKKRYFLFYRKIFLSEPGNPGNLGRVQFFITRRSSSRCCNVTAADCNHKRCCS